LFFNNEELYDAHIAWEHIWKEGDSEIRKNIKDFIQLSAGVRKYHSGNYKVAEYSLDKSRNILMNIDKLADTVDVYSLIDAIKFLLSQCTSLKPIFYPYLSYSNSLYYS
jgi:predicted metal-dependent hydrolase